ncbi:DUF2017 domain-containing protein [Lacisediminihabitans changchengi]|uniref:DUF2017 domain-containing protein n=1 Tax=Lacisediminihabitans changchengi TaxID=2787634 RepID=A0A934SQ00_9MICO|nr:DUF2017 domain-containing protein [Lacisediminihabitans changchengi]MBK4346064.1 DUF2017 domain-containing protein [Lacisediminihabitans changchengi]
MRGFRRKGANYEASFAPEEARLIVQLTGQIGAMLAEPAANDAALKRLLPDAYRDDPEAAEEFRRFTAESLAERKGRNGQTVAASLADAAAATSATKVVLDEQQAQAWIRAVSDIRLTIASRIGIERDDDRPNPDEPLGDIYDWLAFVQESLVVAMQGRL